MCAAGLGLGLGLGLGSGLGLDVRCGACALVTLDDTCDVQVLLQPRWQGAHHVLGAARQEHVGWWQQ